VKIEITDICGKKLLDFGILEAGRVFNRRRKPDQGRTRSNFSPLDLSGENMSSLREAKVGLHKRAFF